jgi:hypothetical protein
MGNRPKESPDKVSRRLVLRKGAIIVAGFSTILVANTNPAAAKMPQTAVDYRPKPKGDSKCSNCKFFITPDSCQKVAGKISPDGYCLLYQKA